MKKSNVVAYSNIYFFKTQFQWYDKEFMKQIEDYDMLKEYEKERRNKGIQSVCFTKKQNELLKNGLRCIYAKNDPCWGYVDSLKRVVSKCINSECTLIHKCNPEFTLEYKELWAPTLEEKELYKNPDDLAFYYIVDAISENEMSIYKKNECNIQYPVEKVKKMNKYRINPITGKKEVIVGYNNKITDNNSYESEESVPIWKEIDQSISYGAKHIFKKAKKIEKRKVNQEKVHVSNMVQNIKESIDDCINLINVDSDYLKKYKSVILCDNIAELQFIISTLFHNGALHNIRKNKNIMLFDDYIYQEGDNILITSSCLKKNNNIKNERNWEILYEKKDVKELKISNREYKKFADKDIVFWTCKNLRIVTHICIDNDDFELKKEVRDLELIKIIAEENKYYIYNDSNIKLGRMSKIFENKLKLLLRKDEIDSFPEQIDGLAINYRNNKIEVLGIGHLNFNSY